MASLPAATTDDLIRTTMAVFADSTGHTKSSQTTTARQVTAIEVSQDIVFFSLTVIIPCGLLFNVLSFAIYMRRQMRKRATSLYLAALAASDTLSLLTIALDYWLKDDRLSLDVVQRSSVVCVAVTYVSYASRLFSAILVTSFTIERCFGVAFPLRRGILSTRAHACRVIAAESIGCFLLTSYTLFTIDVVDAGYGIECDVVPERFQLYLILNTLVLICGSIVVPIVIICTLNVYLVYRIFKRRKFVQKNIRFSDTTVAATPGSGAGALLMRSVSDDNKLPYVLTPAVQGTQDAAVFRRTTTKATTSLTSTSQMSTSMSNATAKHDEVAGLLVLVSSVFVLTNVPYCVAFFLLFFRHLGLGSDGFLALNIDDLFTAKYTTSVLYYLNYSVNFLLYYVWARRFRTELGHMLCRSGWRCVLGQESRGGRYRHERGGGKQPSPPQVAGHQHALPTKRIYRVPAAGADGEILVINKFGGVS